MKWWRSILIMASVLTLANPAGLLAAIPTSKSTNYGVTEDNIGDGTDLSSSSNNYSSDGATLGDTAIGNSASNTYQTGSGYDTTDDPSLSVIVNSSSVSLGLLSTGAKSTGTATFSVKDYSSYGYVVSMVGNSPTNSGHSLTTLATDTASAAGTEQFGINTVLNTTAGVGANPVQVPSGSFSYGVAGDGSTGTFGTTRPYTISDQWRYNPAETIASSPKTSGETDYTLTFMANISTVTPGGAYASIMAVVVTGTY